MKNGVILLISLLISLTARGAGEAPKKAPAPAPTEKAAKTTAPSLMPSIADPSLIVMDEEEANVLSPAKEAAAQKSPPQPETKAAPVTETKPVTPSKGAATAPPPATVPAHIKAEVSDAKTVAVEATKPAPITPPSPPDLAENGIPGNPLPAEGSPVTKERLDRLGNSPLPEVPADAEVAVILSNTRFYPSRIRLKDGQPTRLIFTSLNQKPAALIVEQLQVQRWIAKEDGSAPGEPQPDVTRELNQNRITEILLQPKRGTYTFHDALSGAVGEIVVE